MNLSKILQGQAALLDMLNCIGAEDVHDVHAAKILVENESALIELIKYTIERVQIDIKENIGSTS